MDKTCCKTVQSKVEDVSLSLSPEGFNEGQSASAMIRKQREARLRVMTKVVLKPRCRDRGAQCKCQPKSMVVSMCISKGKTNKVVSTGQAKSDATKCQPSVQKEAGK